MMCHSHWPLNIEISALKLSWSMYQFFFLAKHCLLISRQSPNKQNPYEVCGWKEKFHLYVTVLLNKNPAIVSVKWAHFNGQICVLVCVWTSFTPILMIKPSLDWNIATSDFFGGSEGGGGYGIIACSYVPLRIATLLREFYSSASSLNNFDGIAWKPY